MSSKTIQTSKVWVLLRGLARGQQHWLDFEDHLKKKFPQDEFWFIDLPGNGYFVDLSSPLDISEYARFVKSQIELKQRETQNKKALWGLTISLGSMVWIELISQYKDVFEGGVVINTSFSGSSSLSQRLKPDAYSHFINILRSSSVYERELHIVKMVSNDLKNIEKNARLWARVSRVYGTSLKNALKQLVAAARYRVPKKRPSIPLLFLASEADHMVDFNSSKIIAENWGYPLALHSTSGHEITMDDPDWVVDQIFQWQENL